VVPWSQDEEGVAADPADRPLDYKNTMAHSRHNAMRIVSSEFSFGLNVKDL
jgi:hypothetical protein